MPPIQPSRDTDRGFSGVSLTFARQPIALTPEDLAGVDVGSARRAVRPRRDLPPGTRFGPRAVRLAEDVGVRRAAEHRARHRSVRRADGRRLRRRRRARERRARRARVDPGARRRDPRRRRDPGRDRRRPLDHPAHPARARRAPRRRRLQRHPLRHARRHGRGRVRRPAARPRQPFSRAVAEGALLGGNIVQVGLRGYWPFPEDFDRMRGQGFRWHTMGEIDERGLRAVLDEAIAHARERAPRTYLTVDVDSMDPGLRARHRHARAGRADARASCSAPCGGSPASSTSAASTSSRSRRPTTSRASRRSPASG